MSVSSFAMDLVRSANGAGGAHMTRQARDGQLERFAQWCWKHGFQLHQVQQVKDKHIGRFVQSRLSDGISKRTIQNDVAALRAALRGAGRERYADGPSISNSALGIDNASRLGTKEAMPEAEFNKFRQAAEKVDPGVAVGLELQRVLGLREKEVVMGVKSLNDWARQLRSDRQIHVSHGTKGGRVRFAQPTDRTAAIRAVERARDLALAQKGRLIDKDNLKSAMDRYSYVCRSIGMTGVRASHSLRYAYAQEHLRQLREVGVSEREARSIVSQFLGHGDGRGRWVASVYGRGD